MTAGKVGVGSGTRRKSVLFVVTSLDHGGAEIQVVTLAVRLAARGWRVHVVSLLEPVAFAQELASAGVTVDSLGMRRGVPDPRALFRLAKLYRKYETDVVHAHMVHANILARLSRLLAPVRYLVSTAHNVNEGGAARMLAYRFTDPMSELTTNVSVAGVERYDRLKATRPSKSRFVPNGIDCSRFRRDERDRQVVRQELGLGEGFTWLAIGRFAEVKDYPNMLQALALSGPSATLMIAGQGELRGATEELAKELGISDRVRFLGLRNDISALASAADAFVMSSSVEGLPLALLEAAACGLPVAATDVGGISQVIDAGSGLIVPPRDSAALARAMSAIERLPVEVRNRMGEAARESVMAAFDIRNVLDTWESVYERGTRLAGGKRRRLAMTQQPAEGPRADA